MGVFASKFYKIIIRLNAGHFIFDENIYNRMNNTFKYVNSNLFETIEIVSGLAPNYSLDGKMWCANFIFCFKYKVYGTFFKQPKTLPGPT